MQENVKKCKNFLATLIKLASHNSPSPDTSKNVKALVQDLLVSQDSHRILFTFLCGSIVSRNMERGIDILFNVFLSDFHT